MSRYAKIKEKIMSGCSDTDISEADMLYFLSRLHLCHKRTRGDHFQFGAHGIPEQINLQPQNGKIKPYQVKQIRKLVEKYNLRSDEDEI